MYADDYFAVLRWIHRGRQNEIVLRGLWTEHDLVTSNLYISYLMITSPLTGFILLLPDFHTKIAFVVTKYIHPSVHPSYKIFLLTWRNRNPLVPFSQIPSKAWAWHPGRGATHLFRRFKPLKQELRIVWSPSNISSVFIVWHALKTHFDPFCPVSLWNRLHSMAGLNAIDRNLLLFSALEWS